MLALISNKHANSVSKHHLRGCYRLENDSIVRQEGIHIRCEYHTKNLRGKLTLKLRAKYTHQISENYVSHIYVKMKRPKNN